MITSARILTTDLTGPYDNLAAEELLQRTVPAGQALLFLWRNAHTVVIGAGQNAWRECHTALLRAEGGTLARRASGGGAVYHDLGNLNFSIIVPPEDYDIERQTSVIVRAVGALGLRAERSGRNDITIDGLKFSGNAFRMLDAGALHHGTLLVESDMSKLGRYLNVAPEKLKAKGVRSIPARVVNLSALCGAGVPEVHAAMAEAFSAVYGPARPEALDRSTLSDLAATRARYADWNYIYGASPVGDMSLETRFLWGGVEIVAEVRRGTVRSAHAYTDAIDETLAPRLSAALTGALWRADALAERALSIGEEDIAAWLARAV